jgi:SH3-like domain-containing protein
LTQTALTLNKILWWGTGKIKRIWSSPRGSFALLVVFGMIVSASALAADRAPRPKIKPPVPPIAQPAPPAAEPTAPDDDGAVPPPADKPAPKPSDKPASKAPDKPSKESGLAIPRFVSMKRGEVNVRVGPGARFPIEWVFTRRDMPVEIIAENDVWRKIRDWEGTEGWVLSSQITGRRMVIVRGEVGTLRTEPASTANPVAHVEPGVIGKLMECPMPGDWCRIEVGDVRGWIHRHEIWGVYPTEPYPAP